MSEERTPNNKHHEDLNDTVPASTMASDTLLHTPAGDFNLCVGSGQQTPDEQRMTRDSTESTSRGTNYALSTQDIVTSDGKYDAGRSLGSESIKEIETEGGKEDKVTKSDINECKKSTIEDDGNARNVKSESPSSVRSKSKTRESVTRDSSPLVTEPEGNQELQGDSSSESHPSPLESPSRQPHPTLDTTQSKARSKVKKQKGPVNAKDGKDSDSSVSSRKRASKGKTKIKSKFAPGSLEYIEERLCGRIFSGWVEERQWVESLGGYRDVIEVDEWEVEMNHQLQSIIYSIQGVKEGTRWINITPPRDGPYYRLWVLQELPPTPGHYWYTITGVKLQPHFGLMISVKQIRSIHPHDGELAAARRARLKKGSQGKSSELDGLGDLLQDWAHQLSSVRPAAVLSFIASTITLSNIKETIRFLVVLLMTLILGLVTFVKESHVIGLRFIREAGIFFNNATPFVQTFLGFFEKIVGGLYLLVAMVYRDWRRPSVPPPPLPPAPPSLPYAPSSRSTPGPRALQYVSPQRWGVKTQSNDFT